MDRSCQVQDLAQQLYAGFVEEDGGAWLSRTGEIICQNSLRARKTRRAFQKIRSAQDGHSEQRFWTKKLISQAIASMMSQWGLEIPRTAGFVWDDWLKGQTDKLHSLSQNARRNAWRLKSSESSMSFTDNMDTLNYLEEIFCEKNKFVV